MPAMRSGQVPEVLRGRAPAKVNLVLEVLGKRSDGYHQIDTVLQELELADDVVLTEAAEMALSASGRYAMGTPEDERNLAWRAFELAADCADYAGKARIELVKNIPAAGGLGGGASDAACVLRMLPQWLPGLTPVDRERIANAIGSDEAYFLVGGTARATGRGESVVALPLLPQHDVVLFIPPSTIERKTARMFEALGKTPFDTGVVAAAFASRPPDGELTSVEVFNAFERVAFELFPDLALLWDNLERRIGDAVHLAGAGPTLFWIGHAGKGAAIAARAEGSDCDVILTRTVSRE